MIRAILVSMFRLRTLVMFVALTLLALLVWFVGPLITVGGLAPLDDVDIRAVIIVALFVGPVLGTIIRLVIARRANARMMKSLLDTVGETPAKVSEVDEEIGRIRDGFNAAQAMLRRTAAASSGGRRFVENLPWYLVIGPTGAGKSTLIDRSGLNFPVEEAGTGPQRGTGGATRSCDWRLTDQAVLVDTAGRYLLQRSGNAPDAAGWRGLLDILKMHRGRRPINGVILAVSLPDILGDNGGSRQALIEATRRRLHEIVLAFDLRVPVYVVVTKSDRIAGFTEFFDALESDERHEPLGLTYDIDAPTPFETAFRPQFGELADSLETRLTQRLHEERDLGRRCEIYNFPREFRLLGEPIESFFEAVFKPTRFEMQPTPRGIYFTSAEQAGITFDRLGDAIGEEFGLVPAPRPAQHRRVESFFVRRIFTDVVFEEQSISGVSPRIERGIRRRRWTAYGILAAVSALLLALWTSAYIRGVDLIESVHANVSTVDSSLAALPTGAPLQLMVPNLAAMHDVVQRTTRSGILTVLGNGALPILIQMNEHARATYSRLLIQEFLPSIANWLANRIRLIAGSSPDAGQTSTLRHLLRAYLMLGTPDRLDQNWLSAELKDEAAIAFPVDDVKRRMMIAQIDALMPLLPQPVTLDTALIEATRDSIAEVPPAAAIYSRLTREGLQNNRLPSIDLGQIVGSTALTIAPDGTGSQVLVIPGLYTRSGYYDYFLPRLGGLVREAIGNDWVVGSGSGGDGVFQDLARQVTDSYVADYIQFWQGALLRVQAKPFSTLNDAMVSIQSLAGPQSPLDHLLATVSQNTDLPPPGQDSVLSTANPNAAQQGGTAGLVESAKNAIVGNAANAATSALGNMPWPGTRIATPFIPIIQLTQAGSTPGALPPIARTRDLLSNLYGAISGVQNAPSPPDSAFQLINARLTNPTGDVMGALQADSALRPEPVRSILRSLAEYTWATLIGMTGTFFNQTWTSQALPACQNAIFQKYPFYQGSTNEVAIYDFKELFRAGGIMDSFYTKYLAGLVPDRGGQYVSPNVSGAKLPISDEALTAFRDARLIRDTFFTADPGTPYFKFSLRPVFLSSDLLRATLMVNGKEISYRHEAPRSYDLEWPGRGEATTVSLTLVGIDGKSVTFTENGPWAFFHLIERSGPILGGNSVLTFSIANQSGSKVTYEIRAGSASNPFSLGALRTFRCPNTL